MELVHVSRQRLAPVCTAFGISSDGVTLAMASDSEIRIFSKCSEHTALYTSAPSCALGREYHSHTVSALHWSKDGLLASADHGAGAVVWRRAPQSASSQWNPDLTVTRLQKAVLCAQWSPSHRVPKLALGSVDGALTVCYHDEARSLWAPKVICKTQTDGVGASGIVDLAWHPSGACIAAVSVDGTLAVVAATIPGLEDACVEGEAERHVAPGIRLLEWKPAKQAWKQAVAWSLSGQTLAVATSGGLNLPRVFFLTGLPSGRCPTPEELATAAESAQEPALPPGFLGATRISYLNDDTLVMAGFGGTISIATRPREGAQCGRWSVASPAVLSAGAAAGAASPLQPRDDNARRSGAPPFKGGRADSSLADRIRRFEATALEESARPAIPPPPSGDPTAPGDSVTGHSSPVCGLAVIDETRFLTASIDGTVITWLLRH